MKIKMLAYVGPSGGKLGFVREDEHNRLPLEMVRMPQFDCEVEAPSQEEVAKRYIRDAFENLHRHTNVSAPNDFTGEIVFKLRVKVENGNAIAVVAEAE